MADDERLIAAAQAGDKEALGELLLCHQQACYALALRLTRNPEDAGDVCQDAFVDAVRDVAGYRPTGSFRSWLFSLVVHAYGDRLDSERARRKREEAKAVEHKTNSADEMGEVERVELRQTLDESLSQLE